MSDVFTPYETGLARLLERLGQDYPRYAKGLTLQSRLLENFAQARRYGDTETRRADRGLRRSVGAAREPDSGRCAGE